jgi:O-antigen/teichoic acid export membrane protein
MQGIGTLACAKVLAQAISWASTVLVMRELDPSAYGIVAISAVYVGFASIVSEFGMTQSLLRSERPSPIQARQILGLSIAVSSFTFFILMLATCLYAYLTQDASHLPIIAVQSLAVIVNSVSLHSTTELQREGRHATIGSIEILCVITAAASSLALAKNGYGLYSIILGPLIGTLLKVVTQAQLAKTSLYPRLPSRELFNNKYLFAKRTVPTTLLYQAENNIDLIIGSQKLSSIDTGAYSTATYWANMPFGRIMNVLNQVLLPYYISQNKSISRIDTSRSRADQITIMIYFSCAIFWGIACCASEVVNLLLGEKWEIMAPILTILLLPLPMRFVSENLYLMSLSSNSIIDLRAIQAANLVLVAILALLTSSHGVLVFASAIAAGLFLTSLIKSSACVKHLKISREMLYGRASTYAIFCFSVSLFAYSLRHIWGLSDSKYDLASLALKAAVLCIAHTFFIITFFKILKNKS